MVLLSFSEWHLSAYFFKLEKSVLDLSFSLDNMVPLWKETT